MDYFKKLFNINTEPSQEELSQNINDNSKMIQIKGNFNIILNDLLLLLQKEDKSNLKKLVLLSNPKNCNRLTLFLSKNISKSFYKFQVEELNDDLFIKKKSFSVCKTPKCSELDEEERTEEGKNILKETFVLKYLNTLLCI